MHATVGFALALLVGAAAMPHVDPTPTATRTLLRNAAAASLPPTRAVPIPEATLAPGSSSTLYVVCTSEMLAPFVEAVGDESNACGKKTSYNWNSSEFPTNKERLELCVCTEFISAIQKTTVPRCSIVKENQYYSYASVIEYGFGLCDTDGSSAGTDATTTTPPTIAPPTTTPTTTTPTTTKPTIIDDSSPLPLIGGIAGGVLVMVLIAVCAFRCGKKRHAQAAALSVNAAGSATPDLATIYTPAAEYTVVSTTTPTKKESNRSTAGSKATTGSMGSGGAGRRSDQPKPAQQQTTGLWDDPLITAERIPYESVFFGALLSRGGFGEVYKGTYMGETVAIKQLLPARRKDLAQIDSFLAEVKLLASFDHERIIRFVGVAWNSLSSVCAVVEYMANGDLRSVLTKWQYGEESRPQGFDADKAKIALHIAHALTYLHSLQPVVVHRDLKSKNILLNEDYDAKLADFGISREQQESTMTAGVGTSLWMAPEVMMGERYNEKADVFSFGVVLSELDTHEMPYSHVMDAEPAGGRKIPDSAILQMVSLGRLTIQFSGNAHPDLVQLGKECVLLDPKQRPTSGQVLHRVHQVWRQLQ